MEELERNLQEFKDVYESEGEIVKQAEKLKNFSLEWAKFVLNRYNDKLREKGMKITFAIVDSVDELT